MKYSIWFAETAADDLNETIYYIDRILLNPNAADQLLEDLEKVLEHLSGFPQAYSIVDDPFLRVKEIRFVAIDNHLAFYTIDEDKHIVRIIRFLYRKRNWISVLKKDHSYS